MGVGEVSVCTKSAFAGDRAAVIVVERWCCYCFSCVHTCLTRYLYLVHLIVFP